LLITAIIEQVKDACVQYLHAYSPSVFGAMGAKVINKAITFQMMLTGASIGFFIGRGIAEYYGLEMESNAALAIQFGLGLHGIGLAQESTALIVLFIKTKIIGQKNDN
jgi:hypothetical protein